MKKFLAILFALATALIVTACTNLVVKDDSMAQVKGTLSCPERMVLPSNAIITIMLADVSKMDAPAEIISGQTFLAEGKQAPFTFDLDYEKQQIEPNRTYAVSARIEVDGKLVFMTDMVNQVLTDQAQTTNLDMLLIRVNS